MQVPRLFTVAVQAWKAVALAVVVAALAGAGCSDKARTSGHDFVAHPLKGSSFGGQQPVVGAQVQMYAVGEEGPGSASRALLPLPAITDAHGFFNIPVYTCPTQDTPVYLLATGGSSNTNATSNADIGLMAMLGACGSLTDSTFINMNEVTTVGSIWPLAAYMQGATALGSAPNDTAFTNAVASVPEFINVANGDSPGTPTAVSYFAQQSKLYSLADLLAACINSNGGSAGDGSVCGSLFTLATPASGTAPSDTVSAALQIALSPTTHVNALFNLIPAISPFAPVLASAPPDWTLTLTDFLATPVLSLSTQTYSGPQQLQISCASSGAVIHYTLDGTQPSSNSPVYTSPVSIVTSSSVQAIAIQGSYQSPVASASVTIAGTSSPVHLVFTVQPATTPAGVPFSPAVQVAEEDSHGNVVPSADAPVTLSLNNPMGLTGTLTIVPVNGVATFNNVAVPSPGTGLVLYASAPQLGSVASGAFTATSPVLSFSLASNQISTGSVLNGTVTLSAASTLPVYVTLVSSAPAIAVTPTAIIIPAGQTTASFAITGVATGTATLSATAPGYSSASVTLVDTAPVIQSSLFGMTVENFTSNAPALKYGTLRSWDAYPGLNWADDNQAPGSYYFAGIDQFLSMAQAKSAQVLFTLGRTPAWASSQPNAPGYDGPGECAPPTNIANWDAWLTALANHVGTRIQYWELWNEPQDTNFYCGDMPTMVLMAQHASRILKSVNPNAVIFSPGTNGGPGPAWLQSFLAAGGGAYVDGIAFHGYQSAQAEDVAGVIANYKAVMTANNIANKPLWDTESSWAGFGNLGTPSMEQQVGFIAKDYLLQWSNGVSRFIWYAYDGGSTWGGLLTSNGTPSAAAMSYQQVYGWMVGASMSTPCSKASSNIWSCGFTRSGGYQAEAVWISNSSATMAVPAQFTEYRDLAGNVFPITNSTLSIGDQPILLETGPLP